MRSSTLAYVAALLACAAPPHAPTGAGSEEPPRLQLPAGVRPLRYALGLEIVPSRPGFAGTVEIDIELDAARDGVWLNGRGLRVSDAAVTVGGERLPVRYEEVGEEGVARVSFPRRVGPGRATLRFAWTASWGKGLAGLYLAKGARGLHAVSQLQDVHARTVFPCFDEPRFKTPFDLTVTVPAGAAAVSNGPIAAEEAVTGGLRRLRFAPTAPLPTYLVFVGVGPFEVVTAPALPPNDVRAMPLSLRAFTEAGHGAEAGFPLEATRAFVPWYERYFAIPFPYAKLDEIVVPEFAWGGMENAGAIAFRDSAYLVTPRSSQADREFIASLVAHETSHMWFGDLVTMPWWTDAWLNESFATWIASRAVEAWRPEWNPEVAFFRSAEAVMELDSLASSRAIRQSLRTIAEIGDQFDGMSYEKGGAVLATFERFLGRERFRDALRGYLRAHAHGTGSSEALVRAFSDAAGQDLGPAFASFTEQAGVPVVAARVACEGSGARLLLEQSRWLPRGSAARGGGSWRVPVCARFEAAGRVEERCALLEEGSGSLALGACPAWIFPHAGAASYHRWTLAPADLARLRSSGLSRLSAVEKVSLARNLRAAQQAGTSPWGEAMGAIAALAAEPEPDVALEPAAILAVLRDRLAPAGARPAVSELAARLYGPILSRLGWEPRDGESSATRRLRRAAVEALVFTAREPGVRAEAIRRGAALAGGGGGATDPELVDLAVAAFVQAGGTPALEAVFARLAALDDAGLRPKLVAALARQEAPELAARAAALWSRPELRQQERGRLFFRLGMASPTREALLAELESRGDALLSALTWLHASTFPLALADGCDGAFAERLRAALEPRLGARPEMRRSLAQALERIAICSAEREAEAARIAAFFAAAGPRALSGR